MATFFIRIDTLWQNSPDYFVGPFDTRAEAQAAIDAAVNHDDSKVVLPGRMAGDVKEAVRVHGILGKTEARKAGLTDLVLFGDRTLHSNLLGKEVPFNGGRLSELKQSM